MSQRECEAQARGRVWEDARRWIGASLNPLEHPGCLLWDDGGVEFNSHRDQSMGCNVKGVCLCAARRSAPEGEAVIEILGAGLTRANARFEHTTTISEFDDEGALA